MWSDEIHRSAAGLAYRQAGTGLPVILLHGIPGSARAWEGVAARLPGDVRVIVPDLLGFGASRRASDFGAVQPAAQAAAVDALLTQASVDRAVVVGHDFGGPVAVLLAGRRPDVIAGIALLATNTFPDTPIPFPLSLATSPLVGRPAQRMLFCGASLRMMLRQGVGPRAAPVDLESHLGDRAQQRAIATIFANSLTGLSALYRPVEEHLRALSVPAFVGWGDHDPFFPLAQGQRTADALGVVMRRYPGAGHFLPHERPGEVAADIAALVGAAVG